MEQTLAKSLLTIGATVWVISGAAVFLVPSQMHNLMYRWLW